MKAITKTMAAVSFSLAGFFWAGSASAATFVVDRTDDTSAATACTAAANDCSLRGAILAANALGGADVITLPAGTYTLSVTSPAVACENAAASGDLDITDSVTINGAGAGSTTVNGGGIDRVFDIGPPPPPPPSLTTRAILSPVVVLSDMTIRNGDPVFCVTGDDIGGGIRNDFFAISTPSTGGDLTLNNVVVTQNSATGFLGGGGIYNKGSLTMNDSTVNANTSNVRGGGISNQGTFTINRSTIGPTNTSADGAGIYVGTPCSGSGTISDSTISGNTADDEGGALWTDCNTTILVNSTVSGNSAAGADTAGDGGGIYITNLSEVDLRNVTVTNNTSDSDNDNIGNGGGVFIDNGSTLRIRNSILAGNHDDTTGAFVDCFTPDTGIVIDEDFNLIGDDRGCDGQFTGGSDQVGTSASPINAQLGPLADNGGPTQTHKLLAASTAIDRGNTAGCFAGSGTNTTAPLLTADQRGSVRPFDGGAVGPTPARCDIGAFELGGCGDGIVDTGEQCDDGKGNSDTTPDACRTDCTNPVCGDGVADAGEECDDGNLAAGDGCSSDCSNEVPPACGDGILQSGETCDDANLVGGDGCDANCRIEAACGDGTVDPGEKCDDGNTADGDGCSAKCTVESPPSFLLGDGGCGLIQIEASKHFSTFTMILLMSSVVLATFRFKRRA